MITYYWENSRPVAALSSIQDAFRNVVDDQSVSSSIAART